VLVGGWGARAGEPLQREAEQRGHTLTRVGALAMPEPPHAAAGDWRCWLYGRPRARGSVLARFGAGQVQLSAALVRALAELGVGACAQLCGRFAVVALDTRAGRCTVLRDQLGAQPLVHARIGDGVLFAEHEYQLLELLERAPSPDREALARWIENGLTPRGCTLYDGLARLPAGHRLALRDGGVAVERWWSLRYDGVQEGSREELQERLRAASFAAIARAAEGCERPAVKLSGGLDSACVAAGLHAAGPGEGRALALGGVFPDHPASDERELIEASARHAQLPLELIAFAPGSSMLASALEHIARWRLPPATPNLFLWQPLMARARELGVDGMLDGEGGDELFGCAPRAIADMLCARRPLSAWSLAGRVPGVGPRAGPRVRLRMLRRHGLRQLRAGGAQDLQGDEHRRDGPLWWRQLTSAAIDVRDLLDMGGHYRRADLDEGIERRHPFLYDLQLLEAVLRIPPDAQFDPVRDRPLLRDALTGLIPEQVRTRHVKSYFTGLVLAGIAGDEAGLVAPLRRDDAPVRAYVGAGRLERMLAVAPARRSPPDAGALWRVAIANRWLLSQG
jgi:asparagine synthase (glutamine-hydrolysing)